MWMWIHRVALISLALDSVRTFGLERPEERPLFTTSAVPPPPSPTGPASSVDATAADTCHFPYMAAILHSNGFFVGSGAIVADRWVVATAFQMGAFKPDVLQVRVGSNSPHVGGQLIQVVQLFPHPMFRQFNNDVALLKTAASMRLGHRAQPILVAPSPPLIGESGFLVTWDNESAVMSQADVLPAPDCQVFYPDLELTESNICVVLDHILPYKLSLFGSPLVWNDSLVGLYMSLEPDSYKPAVCTSLAPVINWVRRMIVNETETVRLFPLD